MRPLGVDFYRRRDGDRACAGLKVWSREPADPALGARAGAGEHGLPRRRRAHLPDRAGDAGDGRCLAARHDAGARRRRARSTSKRSRQRLEACFMAVMRGRAENDGYNALVLDRRPAVARRRADPHHLALPAPGARRLFAGLHVGDAAASIRTSRRRSCSCSTRASIRASSVARGARARERRTRSPPRSRRRWQRWRASTRTASCATSSMR